MFENCYSRSVCSDLAESEIHALPATTKQKTIMRVDFLSQSLQRYEQSDQSFCVIQITVDGHKGGKDGQTEAENRNQCYYCNQVFQNANTLRRHCRQAHGKDRCHVCTLCNKAFKRATHLKVRACGKTMASNDQRL